MPWNAHSWSSAPAPTPRLRRGARWMLTALLAWAHAAAAADDPAVSVVCDFAAPRLEAQRGESRVTLSDCARLNRAGAPLLPFRTVCVLLPPRAGVAGVTASELDAARIVSGVGAVEYGRLPRSGPEPAPGGAADAPDPAIYSSPRPYPAARVELASVQRLDGCAVAVLRVYPVQYLPLQGMLLAAPRLRIDVALESSQPQADALTAPRRRTRERVAELVANPALLTAYPPAPELDEDGVGYLLITSNSLVSAFAPLVERKTLEGFTVRVETIEEIASHYAGRDLPEKIRACIRSAYTNSAIRYVLLGGDHTLLPTRYAYVDMRPLEADPYVPCDLYFGCLDGTWNSDGDARWGEPTDGEGGGDVDLLAEVCVGRAPVDTAEEVSAFVAKTLRYAAEAHARPDRALFLAEYLGSFPAGPAQGGDMLDPLLPSFAGYQVGWLDDRPHTTPQWNKAAAVAALNASPHVAVLSGHGSSDVLIGANYPVVRSVEAPEIAGLTNAWPFLAYSVSCDAGRFDNEAFWVDCVGEQLVKLPAHGAFAAVFNSRAGWYDPGDEWTYSGEFQMAFFDALLREEERHLGEADRLSRQALLGSVESSGYMTYRWCYYELTLLGDPASEWQGIPEPPGPLLHVTPVGSGSAQCVLQWNSASNWTYAIQISTNLLQQSFERLPGAEDLTATPPLNTHTVNCAAAGAVFYRIEAHSEP